MNLRVIDLISCVFLLINSDSLTNSTILHCVTNISVITVTRRRISLQLFHRFQRYHTHHTVLTVSPTLQDFFILVLVCITILIGWVIIFVFHWLFGVLVGVFQDRTVSKGHLENQIRTRGCFVVAPLGSRHFA